jgi:putative pyruvate formate lyase activating enzyme
MSPIASPYADCRLCPRACGVDRRGGVDRQSGSMGFCRQGMAMRIASASIHFGEEPPVSGSGGSGTVFFSGCTLRCAFCQNYQISQEGMGREVDAREFARICLRLEERGAHNINLVTGTQFAPSIALGLSLAREGGLTIPALWNGSGYEEIETIELLSGSVDVWLPDYKTPDSDTAREFFQAPDYPEKARAAILRMAELSPLRLENGLMKGGVLLRHLLLPGKLAETRLALEWFAKKLKGRALISVMTQYTPIPALLGRPAPADPVGSAEYGALMDMIEELDLGEGYYQELVPGSDWLPDFNRSNPFSSELSRPVWHWRDGFLP